MEFEKSGLPNNETVRKAFEYSQKSLKADIDERLEMAKSEMARQFKMIEQKVDHDIAAGNLPKEQRDQVMDQINKRRVVEDQKLPGTIARMVEREFDANRVKPAALLNETSEKTPTDIICAVLLQDAIRSPKDFKEVTQEFGDKVGDLIAHSKHVEAYPTEKKALIKVTPKSVQRMLMSVMVCGLENLSDMQEKLKQQGQMAILPKEQAQSMFEASQLMAGVDKQMDERFEKAFNKAGAGNYTPFSIVEKDGKKTVEFGEPKMPGAGNMPVITNNKPKGPPKGPGGGSGLGGNVF